MSFINLGPDLFRTDHQYNTLYTCDILYPDILILKTKVDDKYQLNFPLN